MAPPLFVLGIGLPQGGEWLVIALALLLIFGKRLPEFMRSLGSGVREFKRGMDGDGSGPGGSASPSQAPVGPREDAVADPKAPAGSETRQAIERPAGPLGTGS